MKKERPFGLSFNCPVRNLPCTEGGCAWWDDERSVCGVLPVEPDEAVTLCPITRRECLETRCEWWGGTGSTCLIPAAALSLETMEQALGDFYKLLRNRL